ncbi:hypothetical protein [Oceanobacter antarcticus]|uniref:Uncharacterized protein n=2 Tax=Oceanospirillaceae TaxID=135620 RepID=A0ABW8NDD2_9GAMM
MASSTASIDTSVLLFANLPEPSVNPDSVEAFIARWKDGGGTERAN